MAQQSSFTNVFKYHLSGQLVSRVCSFVINLYLIRNVDLSLLGFLSVRMNLYYQTVGFLSREPLRKTSLNPNLSIKDSFHYALLSAKTLFERGSDVYGVDFTIVRETLKFVTSGMTSSLLFFALSIICFVVWYCLPVEDVQISQHYTIVLLAFVCSTLLEGAAEPLAILSLKLGENAHFVMANSALTLLQKVLAFLLIICHVEHLWAFCVAQVAASGFYLTIHLWKFVRCYQSMIRSLFTGSWLANFLFYRYELKYLHMIGTILVHSLLKQFITDGSAYIMTFTSFFSLKTQAVYDAVERLASLVTRLVLTPVEESAAIYFSSNISGLRGSRKLSTSSDQSHLLNGRDHSGLAGVGRGGVLLPKKVITTFAALLRLIVIFGAVICAFGVPYARLAVTLYGGELLTQNNGARYLALYTVYLLFIAVNGIVECFAFSTMDVPQIFYHGTFLLLSALSHLTLNVALSQLLGPSGFILANCVNAAVRVVYNWRHIRTVLKERGSGGGDYAPITVRSVLPGRNFFILLTFCFAATMTSYCLFGSTGGFIHSGAHLAVGCIMFLSVVAHVYQFEDVFAYFLENRIH